MVGAYYGEHMTPVPFAIRQLSQALANDDALDVRLTVSKINVDRYTKGKTPSGSSKYPPGMHHVRPVMAPDRSSELHSDNSSSSDMSMGSTIKPFAHYDAASGRRPSVEVASGMGGMSLRDGRDSRDSEELVESPLDEGRGMDPFSMSFQQATETRRHRSE